MSLSSVRPGMSKWYTEHPERTSLILFESY
jgi:hypothetical protein